MNLKEVRRDGKIWIEPESPKDYTMFRHCNEGSLSVNSRLYRKRVEPLLLVHGISYISIRSAPRRKSK